MGWALHLREVVNACGAVHIEDMVDRLRRELEPVPSEDLRTKGLFVALLLTAIQSERLTDNVHLKQAVLLYTWSFSQNADVTDEQLYFWAERYTESYMLFIEAFYESLYSGYDQTRVIVPIARIWMNQAPGSEVVVRYLKKWLLLTWRDDLSPGQQFIEHDGHSLPVAKNQDMLRLSAIAVSILSLRPDNSLIETLAICRATLELSSTVEGSGDKRYGVKDIHKNIRMLMRWCYTEEILQSLMQIARQGETHSRGVRELTRSLSLVDPPEEIKPEPRQFPFPFGINPVHIIRNRERLFGSERDLSSPKFHRMHELAVRDDLPDLDDADKRFIKDYFENICEEQEPHKVRFRSKADLDLQAYLPWYAKFFPIELAQIITTLKQKALNSYEDPSLLLEHLSGALNQQSEEIKHEIIQSCYKSCYRQVQANITDDKYFRYKQIMELMIFTADERELIKWFDYIAPNHALREALATFPNPFLLSHFASKISRDHAFIKISDISATRKEKPDEERFTEFSFWCCVLIHSSSQDAELFDWARKQIPKVTYTKNEKYMLFMLMAITGPENWYEVIVNDLELRPYLDVHAFNAFYRSGRDVSETIAVKGSYEDLMSTIRRDIVGCLFLKSKRTEEFKRWGKELMELGCELVGKPPFDPEYRGEIVYELDSKGRVVSRYTQIPDPERTVGSATPSTWGVDYGTAQDLETIMGVNQEEVLNKDWETLRRDLDRLENWNNYDISEFSGRLELFEWARMNKEEFQGLAEAYLDGIEAHPRKNFHLDLFTEAVLGAYLHVDPVRAFKLHKFLGSSSFKRHASMFLYDLWNPELKDSSKINALRKRSFTEANADLEIMHLSFVALRKGYQEKLKELAQEFLRGKVARDRCLGISILPWIADEEAIESLARARDEDPNLWVRGHAEWAYETAQQERSCRELYRETLQTSDPLRVSAMLQQLLPALTPLAGWWRRKIEKEGQDQCRAGIINAMLESYWYRFDKKDKRMSEVFGRKLREYCRGEKLDKFTTPRLWPWWEVE